MTEKEQDFNWTLKDCQASIQDGLVDIVAIMKLEQVAGKLVRDYLDTAKSEKRKLSKSWNLLDYNEQQKLIKYWGYEKSRLESGYINEAERLERQSQEYLKDIERTKFHEERGKINCECSWCEEQKIIKKEVEAERQKIIQQAEAEQKKEIEVEWVKGECSNCYQYKKVDSESGLCRKCVNS